MLVFDINFNLIVVGPFIKVEAILKINVLKNFQL